MAAGALEAAEGATDVDAAPTGRPFSVALVEEDEEGVVVVSLADRAELLPDSGGARGDTLLLASEALRRLGLALLVETVVDPPVGKGTRNGDGAAAGALGLEGAPTAVAASFFDESTGALVVGALDTATEGEAVDTAEEVAVEAVFCSRSFFWCSRRRWWAVRGAPDTLLFVAEVRGAVLATALEVITCALVERATAPGAAYPLPCNDSRGPDCEARAEADDEGEVAVTEGNSASFLE